MTDDSTFDRRSFLKRTSTAGLLGFSGVGSLRASARQDSGDGNGGGEEGPINYLQAVLPAGKILDADLVYRIVVVGGPIQPGERPPPLCFPENEDQWRARDALVIAPDSTTGFFGNDDVDSVNRTRVHLEEPVELGSVYRISGGEYCDGHARVTIHELPPQLSEYFSTEMLDTIEGFELEQTAGNETVGNETAGNETAGNETVGNETVGNQTFGNETSEDSPTGDEA